MEAAAVESRSSPIDELIVGRPSYAELTQEVLGPIGRAPRGWWALLAASAVGVVVLVISSGFAFYAVCPNPGNCQIEIDWPTLSPGIVLAAAGAFLLFMARRRKKSPGT